MTVIILNGCAPTPTVIIRPIIPKSLADDALYPPLEGHYSTPYPSTLKACQKELKYRAIDVVSIITAIRNNNIEMNAIRNLNKQDLN